MEMAMPSLPSLLRPAAAQISPELPPDGSGSSAVALATAAAAAAKFSGIARRPLNRPGHCKVLVVDDSKVNNKITIKVLKQTLIDCPDLSGGVVALDGATSSLPERSRAYHQLDDGSKAVYWFDEAGDGTDAVAMVLEANAAGNPFDIVFMDNTMIRMNGPEAAQRMRSGGFEGLIVGVTGNVMARDVAHYIASGADCVLDKPLNLAELKQILKKFH